MDAFTNFLGKVDDIVWGLPLIILIIVCGIYLTIRLKFLQIVHLPKALRFMIKNEEDGTGEVTSFGALCTALSATIGTGNIVGVATAIGILAGGPGALFWMWIAALFGMATKYSEGLLAVKYRKIDEDGHVLGGPFYYIESGMGHKWRWLAKIFAFFGACVGLMGIGTFTQVNGIASAVQAFFDPDKANTVSIFGNDYSIAIVISAFILAILVGLVVIGGIQRISKVSQIIVPFMAVLYIVVCLVLIIVNINKVPAAFETIVKCAFKPMSFAGGVTASLAIAMQKGVARGLYSNEAGEGSAPVIHSAAQVNHPVEQGITGVAEVFLDTFVICTITGLVLGVTGVLDSGAPGNVLAINAFASVWEPLRYVVAVCLLMFSSTTLMSQWYFGFVGLNYIFGTKVADKFKYVFPCFCIIGALAEIELVWVIQDVALGLLTIPNLIAMVALAPQVRKATKEYFGGEAGGRL